MKQRLLFAVMALLPSCAFCLTVQINDLNYSLFNGKATVISNSYLNVSGNCESLYKNDTYSIPETVSYDGIEYVVDKIGSRAFTGYDYLSKSYGGSSLVKTIYLPSTVKTIGYEAFIRCYILKSVDLGGVETIEYNAFYDCFSLEAINLGGVKSIGGGAFYGCYQLKSIDLREADSIGASAFYGCVGLKSIVIPSTMNSFGGNPFSGCSSLREIIYLPTTAPKNWIATTKTYVPDLISYSSPYDRMNDAHIIEMITFNKNEFEYTGQAPTTTWTNNVSGYTASLTIPTLSSEAGNHEEWIPVTFVKGDESFTANVVYRYTIKPVKLIAKVNNASREYGEENPQFIFSYSGFINGENESVITSQPTINTTATKTSNVGEYPITASGGYATNYKFVYEPGVLTVTKASLSAKVNDATKTYGSQNPSFTIGYYGLKNNESTPAWTTSPIFQTDAIQSSGVGQYTVKAINGVPINYDLGEITAGTLNITPAQLTIKAKDAVRQYYNDDPNFSYTCNGFVNGDNESVLITTPKLSTTATRTSNVGTYEIKVGGTSSPNYSISFVNGTLTVTPRTLTASVGNYERRYNEDNPEFEVNYNGFVGEDDENILLAEPTANTTATKKSNVGTYPIYVTGGIADNYEFIYTSGILTINKAEQQIVWEQDFNNVRVGDKIELLATSTSDLPVTYLINNESIATIYSAGTKQYLDCFKKGTVVVRAWQEGNNNYLPSVRKSLSISIWPIGDVNKDMEIDVADIANVIDVMAGSTNSSLVADADVNQDTVVDVADIATIISVMASKARLQEVSEE